MKGGKAMGISGIDGHLIEAEIKDERLGYVGRITKVNVEPITDLLEKGYIPVVSTIGCDMQGNVYNVNADTAAARIAGAIGAESLLSMTDISGILRDREDPSSLIPLIDIAEAHRLMGEGVISGGMIPKVLCCIDAIEHGVKKVTIMDGRVPHAVLLETLTDEGAGTMVVKNKMSRRELL
jgi:acetylglutamate kinase